MNFTTEKREVFGNEYLKVFLKDISLHNEIKILLSELNSIKRVNITANSREDLTVYPAKTTKIDDLDIEVRNILNSYFNKADNEISNEKISERVKLTKISSPDKVQEIIKTKDTFFSKLKVLWIAYYNHFYGIITVFSLGLAIYTVMPPKISKPLKSSKVQGHKEIIDMSNWVIDDTFELQESEAYPILDKNIFIKKNYNDLIIGGINSEQLEIGFKSPNGEELEVIRNKNVLITNYFGEKVIEFEYAGSRYILEQDLLDWNAPPEDSENWYFNFKFYLYKVNSSTTLLKKFVHYEREY